MIRELLHRSTQSITGAAILLALSSLASRLIGLVRDRIFAHAFGASPILDAYYAAFRLPDAIYNLLIVGALSAGFVPVFLEIWKKNKDEAWGMTSAVTIMLGAMLIVLALLGAIFARPLTELLAPGFDAATTERAIMMTRIMMISPILLGLSGIASGVLQALKSFLVYALAPILYNIGIIVGALVFVPFFGPIGLAWGVVLGACLHLAIQIPALKPHGFHHLLRPVWTGPAIKKMIGFMIPRTLGLGAHQITLIGTTMIASTLESGSISIFHFANNIQYVPIGMIGVSFALAAFPAFSECAAEHEWNEMRQHINTTVRQILFAIVPATILFLLLRSQIVRVILGSGSFDWTATIGTADTLAFFALSFFAQALIPTLARAYYAIEDSWTPFLAGLVGSLVTIIGAILLTKSYGVAGIALGFSLGSVIQLALLWLVLRGHLDTLSESRLLPFLARISLAAVCMAAVTQLLKIPLSLMVNMERFWGICTQGLVAGLCGLGVYLFVCHILKIEEIKTLKESIGRRWMKPAAIELQADDSSPAP